MEYKTKGVCAQKISFEIEDHKVVSVYFLGGCSGNLQGISALVTGMSAEEAVERLQGIRCGMKQTSCPDQLARGLTAALEEMKG